jgi:Kef-type K+ transport system membrane component KefB
MFTNATLLIFLGVSVLLSYLCGRGASLAKTPFIVGYIIAGAILGPDLIGFITEEQIQNLDIINIVTLAFIGFGIGGELQFKEIKKLGKSIFSIVIFEATGAFLLVGASVAWLTGSIPMGLIFGALASATAPAGTVEVIKQYRAKGDLTTTLYVVMGIDDIYALLLYTIACPLAIILLGGSGEHVSIGTALAHAGLEVLISLAVGCGIGWLLVWIGQKIHDRVGLFLVSLGSILLLCGISEQFHLSPILTSMAAGIVAVNTKRLVAKKIFDLLGSWTPPLYVWFFVLIGSRLNHTLIIRFAGIVGVYILARSFGKWGGAFIGGKVSNAKPKVVKYLGLALFSQAGVAVGLALAVSKDLEKLNYHNEAVTIMSVITATTFLVMLVGPLFAKIALFKSGEAQVKD